MSLRTKLYNKIKEHGTWSYGEMCQYVAELGYKTGTAERTLRHLVEENKIHNIFSTSKRNTQYISAYSYLPQKKEISRVEIVNGVAVEKRITIQV